MRNTLIGGINIHEENNLNNIILIKVIVGMLSGLLLEISGLFLLFLGLTGSLDFSISFSNIGIKLTTTHIGIGVLLFGLLLHIITINKKFRTHRVDSFTINNGYANDDELIYNKNSNSRSENNDNNNLDRNFGNLIPLFMDLIKDERYNNLSSIDKEYFIQYCVLRTYPLINNETNHVEKKDINKILTDYLSNKEKINTVLYSFNHKKSFTYECKREFQADGGRSIR